MPKTKPDPAVDDGVVRIPFQDLTFTVPREQDDWPTPVTLALYKAIATNLSNDWVEFARLALGDTQWAMLLAGAPKTGDFKEFIDLFAKTIEKECV